MLPDTMSLLYAACGALCGGLFVPLFNRLPARWLCDFGENPTEDPSKPRMPLKALFITVPLLTALFFFLAKGQGGGIRTGALCAAAFLAALCAAADLKGRIVPVELCILIALASLLHLAPYSFMSFMYSLLGSVLLGGSFLLIGILGSAVYKKEAMGFGDVYFAAALGLYFEHVYALSAFLLTLVLAGGYLILLLLIRRFDRHMVLPLAPFIGGAFTLYFCLETQIRQFFAWYLSLLN